ncbi:Hypothetical protein, putative, partial [Bodo saltans]
MTSRSPAVAELSNAGGLLISEVSAPFTNFVAAAAAGGGDMNTSVTSAGTTGEQATTLEYDFKWLCRLAYSPLVSTSDTSPLTLSAVSHHHHPHVKPNASVDSHASFLSASGVHQHQLHDPLPADAIVAASVAKKALLELTVVRVDNVDVCVTGLVPSVVNRSDSSVSYFPLELEVEPFVQDWKEVQHQRAWWGFNSRGRFGLVVPIKPQHSHAVMEAGGARTAGRVLLPRSITLEPPFSIHKDHHDQRTNERSASRTPYNTSGSHNMSLKGTPQQHGLLLSQSFIENGSFVRAMHLGDNDGSRRRRDDPFYLEPRWEGAPPRHCDGPRWYLAHQSAPQNPNRQADVLSDHHVNPLSETIETVFGEGLQHPPAGGSGGATAQESVNSGLLETDWVLSLFPPKQAGGGGGGKSGGGGGAKADEALSSLPWRDAGELLPHFFQQHASVTASSYAAAMCKHASKMSYDQSQFVAIIGDNRGLFVVVPGRDAAEHCHGGVKPLYIDGGGSMAALGRGAYDISLSGHVYPSSGDSVPSFEAALPHRLQLPTPLHRVRSVTTITIPDTSSSSTSISSISDPSTTIREKLFLADNVVPQSFANPDALWESTVEAVRKVPTHPLWKDAVNLMAGAPSSAGHAPVVERRSKPHDWGTVIGRSWEAWWSLEKCHEAEQQEMTIC